MLPKFLIADNSQELPDTIFVVHTQSPRFIVESDIEDFHQEQKVYWIDEKPLNDSIIEQLMEEAEDFLEKEFENEESLYGEDEDDDDDEEK